MLSELRNLTGKKVVITLSGGLDSTVLLYALLKQGAEVFPVVVNYSQRHLREIAHAMGLCNALDLPPVVLSLGGFAALARGSSQTDDTVTVPYGHYADQTMRQTVVPNRNMVLLSLAAAYAVSLKADFVAYGAHSGDHAIYPDCRSQFVEAVGEAIYQGNYHTPRMLAPFLAISKANIVALGAELNVPFAQTYSCYEGEAEHCGKCGTCVERKEAFALANVADPTLYKVER